MATGSGFLVNNEGVIVTNAHVIDGCRKVLANGIDSSTELTVLAVDGANDLALVQSAKPLGKPLTLAKANAKLMDEIFVAGYPFGDKLSKSVKVTKGIVSSVSGIGNNFSQMQIDASLQPGNSGGPVIDKTGQVVGVAVSKLDFAVALKTFGTLPEDTNFAIKSSVLKNFLEALDINFHTNVRGDHEQSLVSSVEQGTLRLTCF
jgi:S1-C subfamily serine protease